MRDGDRTLLRIAVEELARRRESRRRGPGAAERSVTSDDGSSGDGGRKRMFMAGRMGPDASSVHYGDPARPPVDGPWDLALVVRPR